MYNARCTMYINREKSLDVSRMRMKIKTMFYDHGRSEEFQRGGGEILNVIVFHATRLKNFETLTLSCAFSDIFSPKFMLIQGPWPGGGGRRINPYNKLYQGRYVL